MSQPHLIIGNKNYSSWSFRPWIAMTEGGIAFDETVSPFDEANHNQHFLEFSPAGRVPVLKHDGLVIWESLAILEYLAETFPEAGLWPEDRGQRAMARVICNEMHSSFGALRSECPMNMRRRVAALDVSTAARNDVERIEDIWRTSLDASGGPFLYGPFSNADAMFAPVVNRFHVYDLCNDATAKSYMTTVMETKAWTAWEAAARAEPWIVEEEEV